MKICPQCGSLYSDDIVFCLSDGVLLEERNDTEESITIPNLSSKQDKVPQIEVKSVHAFSSLYVYFFRFIPALLVIIFASFTLGFIYFLYFLFEIGQAVPDNPEALADWVKNGSVKLPFFELSLSIPDAVTIAFLSMTAVMVTSIVNFTTLIITLRNDRRNRTETKLRIEKLELELKELKSKDDGRQIIISRK